MKELNLDGKSDDQIIQMTKDDFYEFIIDVCDSLTLSELTQLHNASSYDEFHTICSTNEMLQRVLFGEDGTPDDSMDNYIVALEAINKNNKMDFDDPKDFIDLFNETTEDFLHTVWYTMISKPSEIKKHLVSRYPLIGIKVISDYLNTRIKDFSLENDIYETHLLCECGKFFKHVHQGTDVRNIITCCSKCGRGIDHLRIVSARTTILKESITKKGWFGRTIKTTNDTSIGLELSEFEIPDPMYPSKKKPEQKKAEPKQTKKKTLLQG